MIGCRFEEEFASNFEELLQIGELAEMLLISNVVDLVVGFKIFLDLYSNDKLETN